MRLLILSWLGRYNGLPPTVSGVTQIALGGQTLFVIAEARIMPDVVGEFGSSAQPELQDAGLVVQVVTVPDDPYCNNIGLVAAQNPQAGTVIEPGQQASIQVYGQPPGGCF